ncbi:MAG TPA: hypothetical protein VKB80_35150 [Kofleriaceae bacterium]|nr:hypothetical protein [Kofleriaceae bacterium]
MAIVRHRAGHHIIYKVLAAAAASAIAAAVVGCTQGEEPDGSGGASPDLTVPAAAARTATASPAPRSPASSTSAAGQTPAASQSGTTAAQTPAQAGATSGQNTGSSAAPNAARSAAPIAGQSAAGADDADDADPSDYHIDDQDVEYEIPRRPAHPRKGRTIQIVLRSSPPGAVAAVDGITVGPTPALWEGAVETTPREFTFVLPGYAMARYRFVPTRSGIVHGTLEPIKREGEDGEQGVRGKRHRPGQAKSAPASR